MRDSWDVLRSLKRYLARALPEWEVRLDDEMATKPTCILARITPVTVRGGQHTSELSFQTRAAAYPGVQSSQELALEVCSLAEAAILHALTHGIDDGRPYRVPLYSYDTVTVDEAATGTDRVQVQDFVRISNLTTNVLPDPEDKRRQTLIVSWTNTWRKTARYDWADGPFAQAVTVEPMPESSM